MILMTKAIARTHFVDTWTFSMDFTKLQNILISVSSLFFHYMRLICIRCNFECYNYRQKKKRCFFWRSFNLEKKVELKSKWNGLILVDVRKTRFNGKCVATFIDLVQFQSQRKFFMYYCSFVHLCSMVN